MACSVLQSTVVIAVVIVTYRAPESMLADCIRSVIAGGGVEAIIVVDNAGSASLPGDLQHLVEVVRPDRNGGFGAGANAGFRVAFERGATRIALLNDDLVVAVDWLAPLVAALDTGGSVGAVQPLLLVAGTEPVLINSAGVTLDSAGAGSDIGYGSVDRGDLSTIGIELFTGGAVLFSAEFLHATNGFDERYFLYYEDVDLGLRGARLGYTYRCAKASRVTHRVSASTALLGDRVVYLRERNRLWCALRHQPAATAVRAIWLSIRRVRKAPRAVHLQALLIGVSIGATRRIAAPHGRDDRGR